MENTLNSSIVATSNYMQKAKNIPRYTKHWILVCFFVFYLLVINKSFFFSSTALFVFIISFKIQIYNIWLMSYANIDVCVKIRVTNEQNLLYSSVSVPAINSIISFKNILWAHTEPNKSYCVSWLVSIHHLFNSLFHPRHHHFPDLVYFFSSLAFA